MKKRRALRQTLPFAFCRTGKRKGYVESSGIAF